MSYRPASQSIATPAQKILEGIATFDAAVTERIESGAWTDDHTTEIHVLSLKLMSLRKELADITQRDW